MKKSIFLAAAILSLVSCTRTEEVDIVSPSGTLTLIARTETSKDTRTIVDSETFVFWEPGDEISVFSGNRCARFVTDLDIESPTASFTGDLPGWVEGQELWAVYPYSEEATFDGQTIMTVLPPVQVARAESFGQGMNLAVAKAVENTLFFYNVGGGVRFSVLEEGIKRVVFEGRDGEELSGTIKIGFDANEFPKVQEIVSGFTSVTLLPPEGQDYFDTDVWYYMVAIPGALDKGYKMTLVKDDEYGERFNFQSLSIKRSIYGSIMYADGGVEFDNPVMHFPETESEWAESIALTESLSDEIQPLIQGYKEELIDLDNLLKEVRKTFGVLEAAINDDNSGLMVMQMDSVCINYLLRDIPSSRLGSAGGQLDSGTSLYQRRKAAPVYTGGSFVSPGGKALILSPFHFMFKEPIENYESQLERCFSDVDVYVNDEADIACFKEDFLGKYDFILLSTHGVQGWTIKDLLRGHLYGNFGLASATPYSLAMMMRLKSLGIKEKECMVMSTEHGNYICMTSSFLKGDRLKDSAVILAACESAKYNIAKDFLSHGVRVITGCLREVYSDSDNIVNEMMLAYMCHGLSFQRAFDYVMYSDKTQKVTNALKGVYAELEWGALDVVYNYWRNNSDPYFLMDPFPYNLGSTTENDVFVFSWESNLEPFTVRWNDHLSGNNWMCQDYSYDVRYDLYVHDTRVLSDLVDKQATWTSDPSIVSDSWYVVAKIMEGDQVLESYKSEVKSFGSQLEYDVVDLGLSVKWATCNLGANRPEDPGDYYAWGETAPKDEYSWETYKWCMGTEHTMTKYCTKAYYGYNDFTDDKTVLDPEDDAAHVKLGGKWRMPTNEERAELKANCTWTWTTQNSVKGYRVTSNKTGYEDKSIFLPITGFRRDAELKSANSGYYWSSSLMESYAATAHYMVFWSTEIWNGNKMRSDGCSIRPVYAE